MDQLERIEKKLDAIGSLLQQLPEVQAATFLLMYEEYQAARLRGKKVSDLWAISPASLTQSRSDASAPLDPSAPPSSKNSAD